MTLPACAMCNRGYSPPNGAGMCAFCATAYIAARRDAGYELDAWIATFEADHIYPAPVLRLLHTAADMARGHRYGQDN